MNSRAPMPLFEIAAIGALSVAGLAFWFFLVFPFGNHNESLLWLVSFGKLSPSEIWTTRLEATANYRPLGQATAYYLFLLAGRSDALVQLFNFLGAGVAWLSVLAWIRNSRLYGLIALVCTGAFFSGYVYLFHLHGVFYSPLLLVVAFWLYQEREGSSSHTARKDLIAFAVALLGSLYHPYSLLLFLALLAGRAIDQYRGSTRKDWARRAVLALAAAIGVLMARPPHVGTPISMNALDGLIASYRLVEVSIAVSAVAMILAVVTALSLPRFVGRWRIGLTGLAIAAGVALMAARLPVMPIWILLCVLKCCCLRRVGLASLIAAAAALPLIAPSGSPTYAVFAVFACAVVTAMGVAEDQVLRRCVPVSAAFAFVALLLGTMMLMRGGINVPVASKLARPLLAEKEKTVQLDEVLEWAIASPYAGDTLVLGQDIVNPVGSVAHAVQRESRPPTYQVYVEPYWRHAQEQRGIAPRSGYSLVAMFGDVSSIGDDHAELVYVGEGTFAGPVRVWRTRADSRSAGL